tara:strand:+ start:531 stop:1622 length:1092 start_codon:yes stop_codon:yes gene_type:complete
MSDMIEQAREVGDILRNNYEDLKYNAGFTVWGVAYSWDDNIPGFRDDWRSHRSGLISEIFDREKDRGKEIVKPKMLVFPKASDEEAYFGILSMRNRDLVTRGFLDLTGREYRDIRDIVDDRRLLDESANKYVQLRTGSNIPENADFFDFLMKYDNEGLDLDSDFSGTYSNLFGRLATRFENSRNLVSNLCTMLGEHGVSLSEQHNAALKSKEKKIDRSLKRAHRDYANKMDISQNSLPEISTLPPKPISNFGSRMVKVGGSVQAGFVDMEGYATRMNSHGNIDFDPERIMSQQLANMILIDVLPRFRDAPDQALNELRDRAKGTDNEAESEALYTTIELLQGIACYDSSDRINHSMLINVRSK